MRGRGSSVSGGRLLERSWWHIALAVGVGVLIGLSATVVGFRLNRDPTVAVSALVPRPSAVDVGFAQAMAIHHGQAVLMADEAVLHASSPPVRLLAREIIVQQSQEIGMMRTWLSDWNMTQLPSAPLMAWMQDDPMAGMATTSGMASMSAAPRSDRMPGMATNRQLARLAAARGVTFDRLFLTLMLRHHEGGIEMARYAVQHAAMPQVRAAAGGMVIDQTNECTLIEELLKADKQ